MSDLITASPLTWPTGWPRTPESTRTRAKFNSKSARNEYGWRAAREVTIAQAIERVLTQLRGFGVSREDAIISTNLRLKIDGMPFSDQRAPTDPGAAVYWTRLGEQQRCMAIDRYDRVADNLAAIAATLEAMRSIERHGGAEILDRAFEGFAALPAPAPVEWWSKLGVQRTASPEVIRAAYRDLVKTFHPDNRDTGDAEVFMQIQGAYDAAKAEKGFA